MTKEQYIQEQLKKYRQADTEIQHHMLIIHLLGEIWELKERLSVEDSEVNPYKLISDQIKSSFSFDLDKMEKAVEGGTVGFPPALSRDERREWIRKNKNDAHKIFNELIKNDED